MTWPIIAVFPAYTSDEDDDDENYYPSSSLSNTSTSTHWSINSSQYNNLMGHIQELETQREGTTQHSSAAARSWTPVTRGITPRSVLGCGLEGLSDEPTLSSRLTLRILTAASTSTDHKDIVKSWPPLMFELGDDVRIWILRMNDYFLLWQIADPVTQAMCACTYLNETLVKRTSWLWLTRNSEAFQDWGKLQEWLLMNYAPVNPELDATLELDWIVMRKSELVQAFINHFETVIADLKWNEPTVCAAFQKKLSGEVLDAAHLLSSLGYLKSFGQFKTLAQWAEDFIKINKRNQADHDDFHYSPRKKTHFANLRNSRDFDAADKNRKPMRERSGNKESNQPHRFMFMTEDEKKLADEQWRWRDLKACVNCGSMEH